MALTPAERQRRYMAKPEARSKANARRRQRRAEAKAVDRQPPAKAHRKPTVRRVVQWLRREIIVPSGLRRGLPFDLRGWQEDWLTAAMADGIREAGLSVARKNAKSSSIAGLLLAHLLDEDTVQPLWRAIVVSLTGRHASELRDQMDDMARASGKAIVVKRTPYPGSVEGLHGARVDFLAADKASGHSVGADLVIIDEAGLLDESKRGLWNAVATCTSARDGRLFAISVRGDGPMFSELAARADLPSVHWQEFAAPMDADLDDERAWHAANPGIAFRLLPAEAGGLWRQQSETRAQGAKRPEGILKGNP